MFSVCINKHHFIFMYPNFLRFSANRYLSLLLLFPLTIWHEVEFILVVCVTNDAILFLISLVDNKYNLILPVVFLP